MPKYILWRPGRRNSEAKTTYNQSKQITRLENKINELQRTLKGYLG